MKVGTSMVYYLILFIVTLIFSIIAAALEIPTLVTFIIIFVVIFPSIFFMKFYPLLWMKDIGKLEKYLQKNLKDPLTNLHYALANQLDDQVDEATDQLLQKYRNQKRRALFQTISALYKNDLEAAEKYAELIEPKQYYYYYAVALATEKGNKEEAYHLLENVTIPWMQAALKCELERKAGNLEEAERFAMQAFEKTRGVQRYILYKEYERYGFIN